MRKPGIPEVKQSIVPDVRRVLEPLKESMEIITAQRSPAIKSLPSTATTAQIIEKINEILDRLQ